jgi:hypothetical protein
MCKGIKTMTENKSQNKIDRIRKVMARKSKYKLPELDESELLLDSDDIEYEQDKTESWLESFNGKSEYEMSEMLFAQTW